MLYYIIIIIIKYRYSTAGPSFSHNFAPTRFPYYYIRRYTAYILKYYYYFYYKCSVVCVDDFARADRSSSPIGCGSRWRTPKEYETESNIIIIIIIITYDDDYCCRSRCKLYFVDASPSMSLSLSHSLTLRLSLDLSPSLSHTLCRGAHTVVSIRRDRRRRPSRTSPTCSSHRRIDWQTRYCGGVGMYLPLRRAKVPATQATCTKCVRSTCKEIMVIVKMTRTMPRCHYNNIFINTTVKIVTTNQYAATATLQAAR